MSTALTSAEWCKHEPNITRLALRGSNSKRRTASLKHRDPRRLLKSQRGRGREREESKYLQIETSSLLWSARVLLNLLTNEGCFTEGREKGRADLAESIWPEVGQILDVSISIRLILPSSYSVGHIEGLPSRLHEYMSENPSGDLTA